MCACWINLLGPRGQAAGEARLLAAATGVSLCGIARLVSPIQYGSFTERSSRSLIVRSVRYGEGHEIAEISMCVCALVALDLAHAEIVRPFRIFVRRGAAEIVRDRDVDLARTGDEMLIEPGPRVLVRLTAGSLLEYVEHPLTDLIRLQLAQSVESA